MPRSGSLWRDAAVAMAQTGSNAFGDGNHAGDDELQLEYDDTNAAGAAYPAGECDGISGAGPDSATRAVSYVDRIMVGSRLPPAPRACRRRLQCRGRQTVGCMQVHAAAVLVCSRPPPPTRMQLG